MNSRRNIRKRHFEGTKSLRLFRDCDTLLHYINGENVSVSELETFKAQESVDNIQKISDMFSKRLSNIPNTRPKQMKDVVSSEKSANTDVTKDPLPKTKEQGPIKFEYQKLDSIPFSYIKYKPRLLDKGKSYTYADLDYMMNEEDWEEAKTPPKGFPDRLRDTVEEIIDKLEKFTARGEVPTLDSCKTEMIKLGFLKDVISKNHSQMHHAPEFQPRFKQPTMEQFKQIYSFWVHLRKQHGKALLRIFWRKPDPNDNSPNVSFRSLIQEKIQTRRKKNDKGNFMKLKLYRKELFNGRNLCGKVMEREMLKLSQLDLDYIELKQMIMEKVQPNYQNTNYKEVEKFLTKKTPQMDYELSPDLPQDPYSDKYDSDEPMPADDERMKKVTSQIPESPFGPIDPKPNQKTGKPIAKPSPAHDGDHIPPMPHLENKVRVDPITVTQVAVMFKKLYYFAIAVDDKRIKINNHKPIKKEEFLNLPQHKIDEECYYRAGTKPKVRDDRQEMEESKIRYTIFKSRAGRVMIIRKAENGKYKVVDKREVTQPNRLRPETASYLKRLSSKKPKKHVDEPINRAVPSALMRDIEMKFGDLSDFDDSDKDEDMDDA